MDFIGKLTSNKELILVGEFKIKENNTNLISFDWSINNLQKKDKRGRIYFFIEQDSNNQKKVLKIGKSNDKNGIRGTIGFYINTLSGTPSVTRFSLHHLIHKKLKEGKKILVYSKYSESIKKEVTGIFEKSVVEIPLDITYIENLCLKEYIKHFSEYPEWNFQESDRQIPLNLIENYGIFIQNKKNTRIK